MSDLRDELLAKPVGPAIPARQTDPERDFTRQIEVSGEVAEVTVRGAASEVDEDAATAYLRSQGLDPADWTATGFRSSEWTMASGETGVSTRFTYARRGSSGGAAPLDLDELLAAIGQREPCARCKDTGIDPEYSHGGMVHGDYPEPPTLEPCVDCWVPTGGSHTFIVALGDMQFGKIDGDGVGGTLRRTIDCLDKAAKLLDQYRRRFDIGHVHVAFLGDHVEGFQSQGGANAWRTQLTLTEQIRLTRRVMLHAMLTFAPLVDRLSMAAVPGNHGEAVRINGKGVTRYDDSHDTESLIAVKDAANLVPDRFGHVEFYVPDTDELTVVVDCSGTIVAHAHGHQWRPGKQWEWWKGQAFNKESAMHQADLLLAGHLHHEHIDTDGPRTFIQPPAMESESTWWRHAKGTTGAPGLIVAVTKDGQTNIKEVVR